MTEPLTTYTARALNTEALYEFKYTLNGDLKQFTILEGILSAKQMQWLFAKANFPASESIMKTIWMVEYKKNFDIQTGEPDLSFDKFWNLYNHKVKNQASQTAWKRLSKKDRLEAIKAIKSYDGYLFRKKIAKANASTYLNQRYFEDAFSSIH